MWGFFLNFSRLLKDFRKIKYAMPCNAMHPMQDYFFGRIFIRTTIRYAIYLHSYVDKILFL
jgi:hypothetical protein